MEDKVARIARKLRRVTPLKSSTFLHYSLTIMNTELPKETNIKEWTNMPPIREEVYIELVKVFNNERLYFFNDSYNLED